MGRAGSATGFRRYSLERPPEHKAGSLHRVRGQPRIRRYLEFVRFGQSGRREIAGSRSRGHQTRKAPETGSAHDGCAASERDRASGNFYREDDTAEDLLVRNRELMNKLAADLIEYETVDVKHLKRLVEEYAGDGINRMLVRA